MYATLKIDQLGSQILIKYCLIVGLLKGYERYACYDDRKRCQIYRTRRASIQASPRWLIAC